jgi:hypothetical protein
VDEGRLLMKAAALRTVFEARRTMLILTASPMAVVPEVLTVELWLSEAVLVFLES